MSETTAQKRNGKFVAPGGGGVLADGGINTDRFSSKVRTEFELEWWNRKVSWKVRREPTEHRVVVAEIESTRWSVHLQIAAVMCGVILLGAVVFGGLPLIYGLMLAGVLAVAVYLLLRFEQLVSGTGDTLRRITVLDTPVWAGIKARLDEAKKDLPAEQKKRFGDEVERRQAAHKEAKARAKALGEPAPEYVKVDKDDYVDPSRQKDTDDLFELMETLMSDESRASAEQRLEDYYRLHPEYPVSLGRGVVDCGCVACRVNAADGVVPEISGVVAAKRRRRESTGSSSLLSKARRVTGLSTTSSERRAAKARKELERKKKAEQIAAENAKKKKRTAAVKAQTAQFKAERKAAKKAGLSVDEYLQQQAEKTGQGEND